MCSAAGRGHFRVSLAWLGQPFAARPRGVAGDPGLDWALPLHLCAGSAVELDLRARFELLFPFWLAACCLASRV